MLTSVEADQAHHSDFISQRFSSIDENLKIFENRFSRLLPILQHLRSQNHSTSASSEPFRDQIRELQAKVSSLQESIWNQGLITAPPQTHFPSLEAQVLDLQAQLKFLQLRIIGDGVQIGTRVFQSFDDVLTWVTTDLPNRRYGLFVDAVSLLDFFTSIGHVDAEKTFSAFYSQQKSGFTSMYEARVAASVQNLFPMVFGRSDAAGMDASDSLPAISDPDKWDNGATGLCYQITRSMGDVEYQLESTLDTVLADYSEARQIARECLFKAKRFVMELCAFMSQDYQKWKFRGHTKRDAWKMTAVSVRRIFEEIHSERVVARDVYDQSDKDFSTARFLWATWKAHVVMARYLKHQFYEHPSIAAVLARHLADNYVKPDEAMGSKLKDLEKAMKTYSAKVDYLISKDPDGGLGKRGRKEPAKPVNGS